MLHIYNTLTRTKEVLAPITPGKVRMYVCGMTVYDYCHVGHARVMVVFDMVARYLRHRGYEVTYVRNITDIDDKIIKRAQENKESVEALTTRFTTAMHEDATALGVLPPDQEPRATVHLAQIVEMIKTLIARGYAYQAANRDVYYRVRKFAGYGALSGKTIDELHIGSRVEVGEDKDDPLDFVLWKSAKPDEPRWDSPWGPGRPGWHIECSAMATACLGAHFDIHGGGMDLKFPHHENEIAQSEAATGEKFVNTWMHIGFVRVAEEKMSKSLGNFFTVRQVFKQYRPEVLRYFILSSHYRSPLDYSDENLENAQAALDRFYIALRGVPIVPGATDGDEAEAFYAVMNDDFNTPKAFAELAGLANSLNKAKAANDAARASRLAGLLRELGGVLGLLQSDPEKYLQKPVAASLTVNVEALSGVNARATVPVESLSESRIRELIARRNSARKDKNWAESDRIRQELKAAGVILEDTAHETTWRRE